MKNKVYSFTVRKKFFSGIFLGLLATFVSLSAGIAISAEVVDRIVAIVNDDIIRLVELDKAAFSFEEQVRSKKYFADKENEEIYKIRMEILNNLIDEKLADQEIRNSGIFVDEREIDNAIEQVKAMNYYSDEDLRRALTASGVSMEEYREEIKHQILRNKLVNIKIKSKIIVTDTDIKSYYDNHPEKYASKQKYQLRNILMTYPVTMDTQSKQAVYSRMEGVLRQLGEGATFQEMAQEISEAMNASDGGSLGLFSLDELNVNIAEAIKDLNPGDVSLITDTDQGYQIFLVEKKEETGGQALSEVTEEISQLLYEESVNEKFQSWVEHLREDAHIKIIR
ncbi:MAG: SurA N-terminal domain-containing protein [Desulfobacteraceae bacterium]|jgi:peptidyl-prolyl cis-trans isomerase SurA|nr:SurA N-terminal domain-containing protein [Desulfobacteraceae bacterium]